MILDIYPMVAANTVSMSFSCHASLGRLTCICRLEPFPTPDVHPRKFRVFDCSGSNLILIKMLYDYVTITGDTLILERGLPSAEVRVLCCWSRLQCQLKHLRRNSSGGPTTGQFK